MIDYRRGGGKWTIFPPNFRRNLVPRVVFHLGHGHSRSVPVLLSEAKGGKKQWNNIGMAGKWTKNAFTSEKGRGDVNEANCGEALTRMLPGLTPPPWPADGFRR